jgi:hypothetical protein
MLNIWNYVWKFPYLYAADEFESKRQIFNVIWIDGNVKAFGKVTISKFEEI